ncbi:exonuclease domain-containing protein [Frondihabitans peucedani]|uniref:Exonuclease domain-containing protein n=1 Tax=Frondihabitans peucedani TaxID=598626 RepID=A0ABP8DWR1_9MICO
MTHNGYAVLDFETTGLSPSHHHRVIEIGIVHVSPSGELGREYQTVLNPGRDLGPTRIHGIVGADVRDAPTFSAIAAKLVELLAGRVVVTHNTQFDIPFLNAELERAGFSSPLDPQSTLCTMKLASTFLPGSGRKLADCCAAYDIELTDAHEALADARATAQLLAAYLDAGSDTPEWWEKWGDFANRLPWPTTAGRQRATWYPRPRRAEVSSVPAGFLEALTDRLPPLGASAEDDSYAAMLDRALSDGFLSLEEADDLHQLAKSLGLDERQRRILHDQYFDALVEAAWSDGILTPSEASQIGAVAKILNIEQDRAARALEAPSVPTAQATHASQAVQRDSRPMALSTADVVVITGELWAPRDEIASRLLAGGVTVAPAVTKKTTLLVAADPDSLSGKARKARHYGIPVMSGEELRRLL